MPIDLKAYAKDVEEQIKRIRDDLAPLEAGKMTIGGTRRKWALAGRHAGHGQAPQVLPPNLRAYSG